MKYHTLAFLANLLWLSPMLWSYPLFFFATSSITPDRWAGILFATGLICWLPSYLLAAKIESKLEGASHDRG